MATNRTVWCFDIVNRGLEVIDTVEICITFNDVKEAEYVVFRGISIFPKELRNIMQYLATESHEGSYPTYHLDFLYYAGEDIDSDYHGTLLLCSDGVDDITDDESSGLVSVVSNAKHSDDEVECNDAVCERSEAEYDEEDSDEEDDISTDGLSIGSETELVECLSCCDDAPESPLHDNNKTSDE